MLPIQGAYYLFDTCIDHTNIVPGVLLDYYYIIHVILLNHVTVIEFG